jgi:hypothetical protein
MTTPLVDLAAPETSFDDLADQAVPGQAGGVGVVRAAAADRQLHQFAGPHPGQRGSGDRAGVTGDPDQGISGSVRQGQRPRDRLAGVRARGADRVATPQVLGADLGNRLLQQRPGLGEERLVDVPVSRRPQQVLEVGGQQRVLGVPPQAEALGQLEVLNPRQRLPRPQMFLDQRGKPAAVPQIPRPLDVAPGLALGLQLGPQVLVLADQQQPAAGGGR